MKIDSISAQTCSGNIFLSTQADVDAFNCSIVTGDLFIGPSNDITSLLSLSGLSTVNGNLIIQTNNALTNLDGLSGLNMVGLDLRIEDNNLLENINGLSNLQTIGRDLLINVNASLSQLNGLSSLKSVGDDITISFNFALSNIDGLSMLNTVNGDVFIEDNSSLTSCCGIDFLIIDAGINGTLNLSNNADGCNSTGEISDAQCCPDFTNIIPVLPLIMESSCSENNAIVSGTIIASPSNCPRGATLQYSTDGINFTNILPSYDDTSIMTISTKCVCEEDNAVGSAVSMIETVPVPAAQCCPDFTNIIPVLPLITENSCSANSAIVSGSIIASPSNCPQGATLQYSTDGINFTNILPSYDDTSIMTISTKCVCEEDNAVGSAVSMIETAPITVVQCCPGLTNTIPVLPLIMESSCSENNAIASGSIIASPSNCPQGATLQYSTDGINFTSILPSYDDTSIMTISTKCICEENNAIVSAVSMIETAPVSAAQCCLDLINIIPVLPLIMESSCSDNNAIVSGSIIASPSNCPQGSTLQYSTDGINFTNILPSYDDNSIMTISTKCICEENNAVVSAVSMIETAPDFCKIIPTFSQWGLIVFGLLILNISLLFTHKKQRI